ncbi:MAG TPA: hypothetical protein VF721_13505 [Pyrinomonadaceae bacterium]|jgi:energy-coupling factor transporter ATP-binding protein EcfA2
MNIEINSKSSADEIKPYPGLRPFEYKENYLFFGREGKAQEIASRLQQSHFVAVVGTSGSGKSSLVRAGLLPLLYGGMLYESGSHWRIAIMRPEETPIHNLAEALTYPVDFDADENCTEPKDANQIAMTEATLRRSGVGLLDFLNNPANDFDADENLLVVVDQFEELFRFKEKSSVEDMEEAAAFVKLLLEATRDKQGRIFVVITMRSDFLGDCAEFRDLPEAINDGQYLIPRMTRDQLRQSIESPAFVGDAQVAPALVNRLLNDLEDQNQSIDIAERNIKDHLPILQHALMRTWDLWQRQAKPDEPIDIKHYEDEEIGGMAHALSRHANEAFNDLDERQQAIAEKMFKCLTETDNENREIRRPAKIEEICAITGATEQEACRVIDVFRQAEKGRTFLMPPAGVALTKETKIDLSHESLIRNWERLRGWVKNEAENAWLYRRISEDAALYNEYGQDVGSLWSGRALELALKWREEFAPTVAWGARYQRLSEKEKSELNNLRKTAPLEEAPKRREIINRRFQEAMTFLDASRQEEAREHNEREQILKIRARERFNKMLGWAAAGLVVLVLVTTVMAYVAYRQRKSALEQYDLMVQAQNELQSKNKELVDAQSLLQRQNEILNKAKEKLEEQTEQLKEAQDELNKNNKDLQKSVEQTREEKQRADEQAQIAKKAQAEAQKAADEAISANAELASSNAQLESSKTQLESSKNLLNYTLKGTIAAESSYDNTEPETIFREVLKLNPCGQPVDAECRKLKSYNDWWAYHNIANSSVLLHNYKSAEENFQQALRQLEEHKALIAKNDFSPLRAGFILNVSYKQSDSAEREELNRSKIITLKKFGEFYQQCGVKLIDCSKNPSPHERNKPPTAEKNGFKIYFPKAITEYQKLLDTLGGLDKEDVPGRIFKGDIELRIADMYKALEDFGAAKKYYTAALENHKLEVYELDPEKSAETVALMKNLLESTIQQLPAEPDAAKNLREADDLVGAILIKTERALPSAQPGEVSVLYNKTIGDAYETLSKIYEAGTTGNVILSKARELDERARNDNKIKELRDKLYQTYGNDDFDNQSPNDLTPEQKEFWNETIKYLQINDALSRKMSSLSNIGQKIHALHVEYDNSSIFERRRALAEAYIENNECAKAFKIVEEMYADRRPNEAGVNLEQRETAETAEQERKARALFFGNLKTLAGSYHESWHDDARVVGLYDEWLKGFKEKISDNAKLSEEDKFTEGKDYAGFYIEIGRFYYLRGDYAKAQEMFNEYHKFADKNDAYLSPVVGASEWNRPRVSLTRIQLDILTARAAELRGNKEAAIAEYGSLLSRVQTWLSSQKQNTIITSQFSNTANVNRVYPSNVNQADTANVNRTNTNAANSNIANTATNANKIVAPPQPARTPTPYVPAYLNALYKEAALYEAYLRVRLADLYFSTGQAENVRIEDLLNEKSRFAFRSQAMSVPFILEGYISGLRNIAKFKQPNNEQSALYYQYALEALNSAALYRNKGYYSETYLRRKTLSKEFYDDYIDVLTSLNRIKDAAPDRADKLADARKKREKALTFKELEKPFICADEPVPQTPRSNLTAVR